MLVIYGKLKNCVMNCVDFLFSQSEGNNERFVIGKNENISFALLKEQVDKLAIEIYNKYGTGNKIVLLSSNSIFFLITYFAVMKSANVIVPLNTALKKESLDFIHSQADVNLAFISKRLKIRFDIPFDNVWNEDDVNQIIDNQQHTDYAPLLKDDVINKPAQIIYTSGSTALPKGVMISHKNIIANTTSIIEYLELTSNDIMEVVLPFYYCYGLSLLHTHLKVKGKIVLNNNFMFIGSVLNDLKKYKCTGFAGVPSHFQILLRKADHFIKGDFPDLRYVTQAGGKLHSVFIKEFVGYKPDVDFFVMYGQTEATARLSYLPKDRLCDKLGSIGKGIPGVELKVVNSNGNPVVVGEIGEIVAKGDNVMLGYYKDEETTKQTIKDGWLYTGDLATVDKDGYIFHAARKKEIIKVGGKRVSPKEIEEVIVSMPGVIDCTIMAVTDDILGEAIKAIIVKSEMTKNLNEKSVKAYCSSKLASYQIPKFIEFTAGIKMNGTGKKVVSSL